MSRRVVLLLVFEAILAGCQKAPEDRVQGYVEGEFVYVASPLAGQLETLAVQRGSDVKGGMLLFSLESAAEQAARDQAARRLAEGEAKLADAKKGLRASEMQSLEAQLNQARVALVFSEKEFVRQTGLTAERASSVQDLDRARAARDQDKNRVAQLEADLQTARLGARSDQISAAEANVQALTAALARTEWDLSRKQQKATVAGLVFDTLYQKGEWVPAGRPVVSLLPPGNMKVRAFVPEPRIGKLRLGDPVQVTMDGVPQPLAGKVSFISPQAEYTPPVIYSQQSRDKLVFMVEVRFDAEIAARLHPGQPVDVKF
jgi:HlyD family secretion protein